LNLKKAAIVRKTIRGMVFSEAGAQAGTERHRLWVAKLRRCAKHNCVLLSAPKKNGYFDTNSRSFIFALNYSKTIDINVLTLFAKKSIINLLNEQSARCYYVYIGF